MGRNTFVVSPLVHQFCGTFWCQNRRRSCHTRTPVKLAALGPNRPIRWPAGPVCKNSRVRLPSAAAQASHARSPTMGWPDSQGQTCPSPPRRVRLTGSGLARKPGNGLSESTIRARNGAWVVVRWRGAIAKAEIMNDPAAEWRTSQHRGREPRSLAEPGLRGRIRHLADVADVTASVCGGGAAR